MSKALIFNIDKCTGCMECELACSFLKHGEFNPSKSRIRVTLFQDDALYIPTACYQCDTPGCAMVCPTAALDKRKSDGLVPFYPEKCIGCKMCTIGCPFGVIHYDEHCGKVHKCDLCDGDPECVRFCTYGALEYKEVNEGINVKRASYARLVKEAHKEVKVS